MSNKQIIILVGITFLAFVGYKIISSNIQENKEKAVLQEKYQLEQLLGGKEAKQQQDITEQLNSCIADAEVVKNKAIIFLEIGAKCWGVGTLVNGTQDECFKNNGEGREMCELQQGRCVDFMTVEFGKVNAKFEKDKQECYIRYK